MKNVLSKHTEPDPNLLKEASSGNHRAFTQIVQKYEDLVYNFAFKVCRNKEKASQTMQDTFVNVYRKLDQFDQRSKFTTWLYSIVTNNCLMKNRKTKLDGASISIDAAPFPHGSDDHNRNDIIQEWRSTPLDKLMNNELKYLLDNAIQKLPDDYRIVFILRDVEGRSAEETAKILKLTIPAVKSRLRRARVFLRDQLNRYMTI